MGHAHSFLLITPCCPCSSVSRILIRYLLQLCHLPIPAVVAYVLDHLLGSGQALPRLFLLTTGQVQPGVLQMTVRLIQPHPSARGDGQRFLQVGPGPVQGARDPPQLRSGQQAMGQVILSPCLPQAVHRLVQVDRGLGETCPERSRRIACFLLPSLKQVGPP